MGKRRSGGKNRDISPRFRGGNNRIQVVLCLNLPKDFVIFMPKEGWTDNPICPLFGMTLT